MQGEIKAMVIPYKSFKHRIRLMKKYERDYSIINSEGYLYLIKREVYVC